VRLIIALLMAAVCSSMAYAKPTYIHLGKHVAKEAYPRAKRGRKNFSRYRRATKPKTAKRKPQKPPAPKRREQNVEAKNNKKSLTSQQYNRMMFLWIVDVIEKQETLK